MGIVDDRRHSVLSKGTTLSQTQLAAFLESASLRQGPLLPDSRFGTYEVKEVRAKTALTVCRMPGDPWSLNPYMGCSHACAYCYVPDVAHVERVRWGSYVLAKRNLPRVLSEEVHRHERKTVLLSTATDPYQPAEAQHRITRRSLEILLRAQWPLRVLTRSPLVRRDIDLFTKFEDFEIGMSVPTVDDRIRALVEPGAPPIAGRLNALRALADEGLKPFANYAPAYPLTPGMEAEDVARAFKEAAVATVFAFPFRYLPGVLPVMRERLAGTPYEPLLDDLGNPQASRLLLSRLRHAFAQEGVEFQTETRADRTAAPTGGPDASHGGIEIDHPRASRNLSDWESASTVSPA
jgi:DNA repair photolyase